MTEPLTPQDCDLRDYVWMPMDCNRLLSSETWVLGNAEEKVASLTLWMKSWHQVPAGSLPDNDKMLAHMSEAGAKWPKLREHALRGWVKCDDGRLYHPVVCEKAREAWANKLAQKARTESARAAKAARRSGLSDGPQTPPTAAVTESVTERAESSAPAAGTVTSDADATSDRPYDGKFNRSEFGHNGATNTQPIEIGRNRFLSQTLPQAPTEQNRTELKKEKEISLPVPEPADAGRAETAAAPQWPPPPLPSAIAATVGVLTAKLEGRHRDTKPPGPVAPRRTAEEQLAALGKPKLRAHYASDEALKRARAELALRAAPAEGNA